jgi:hypothetical protein
MALDPTLDVHQHISVKTAETREEVSLHPEKKGVLAYESRANGNKIGNIMLLFGVLVKDSAGLLGDRA